MKRGTTYRARMLDTPEIWVYGSYYEADGQAVILHESRGNLMQHTAVIPETAGSYTGQSDDVGQKLYEGDKVLHKGKEWVLRTNQDYCGYELDRNMVDHGENGNIWFMCDIACRCRKIGTIHD